VAQVDLGLALLWYAAFVLSTTAHEGAHAWVAYLGGDPTAYRAGQVTLSPLPHMRREPFGMVVIPLLSIFSAGWCVGWASTPYDPRWERAHPRRAAWMAAAGPGTNLALAAAALVLLRLGLAVDAFTAPEFVEPARLVAGATPALDLAGSFLSILLVLNAILAAFNLIPFPPLDGASAITLVLPGDLGLRYRDLLRSGPFPLLGLLAAWYLFGAVVPLLFRAVLALVHPAAGYG
jgi:Zn-dependent protease